MAVRGTKPQPQGPADSLVMVGEGRVGVRWKRLTVRSLSSLFLPMPPKACIPGHACPNYAGALEASGATLTRPEAPAAPPPSLAGLQGRGGGAATRSAKEGWASKRGRRSPRCVKS